MWETWVRSLGGEDPLEKGMATHSSNLAWRIPWTVWSMGSQRVGHDWATFTSLHFTDYSKEFSSDCFQHSVILKSVVTLQGQYIIAWKWLSAPHLGLSFNSYLLQLIFLPFCPSIFFSIVQISLSIFHLKTWFLIQYCLCAFSCVIYLIRNVFICPIS